MSMSVFQDYLHRNRVFRFHFDRHCDLVDGVFTFYDGTDDRHGQYGFERLYSLYSSFACGFLRLRKDPREIGYDPNACS